MTTCLGLFVALKFYVLKENYLVLKNTRGGMLVYDQNFYGGTGLVDGVGEVTVKDP